jgi:hypothetical protein
MGHQEKSADQDMVYHLLKNISHCWQIEDNLFIFSNNNLIFFAQLHCPYISDKHVLFS